MSTIDQVNNDYFFYVVAYLILNNVADETLLSTYQLYNAPFTLQSTDGKTIQITQWSYSTLKQPTINDLMAIPPAKIVQLKKSNNAYQFLTNPNLLTILRDIYNRISLLPNTGTYQTNADLITFLKTLF